MAGDSMKENGESSHCEERRVNRLKLEQWLNKSMRIKMTDGRTLIGTFLCTDCDCNIIMGSCEEYLKTPDAEPREDPRILGLAMIPGKHVVSIEIDDTVSMGEEDSECPTRNNSCDTAETTASGTDISTSVSDSERNIAVDYISS
ncbi:N-alpha-acetyltransferase 38 NatC auxiliary subunit [Biomphalaria glabrata]|nr:N-alpha-acetyltransferase 38; NatC auxiliary subunit-like [Biomphalaria glabrata]